MTGKERIITALQRGVPDRVPTFEWFIDPAIARSLGIPDDPIFLGGGYILPSSNTIHSGVKPGNYLSMVDELCS